MKTIKKTDYGYLIKLEGVSLTLGLVDSNLLVLSFGNVPNEYQLQIESSFVITDVDGISKTLHLTEKLAEDSMFKQLLRSTSLEIRLYEDGGLELTDHDRVRLHVEGSSDYEPWNLVGPDGFRAVSTTDHALAVW